jgi:hypothetical protein
VSRVQERRFPLRRHAIVLYEVSQGWVGEWGAWNNTVMEFLLEAFGQWLGSCAFNLHYESEMALSFGPRGLFKRHSPCIQVWLFCNNAVVN